MATPDEASFSSLFMQSYQPKQSNQDVIDVDECDDSRNKSTSPDNICISQCGYKKTEIIETSDDSDTEIREVHNKYGKQIHKEYPFQDICTWINNLK